ncbi:hypothetical protein SACE_0532 [Saccharopolyspora erythraea NRRL 2338]|uniref:Transcriptional regulator, TetR family n=2 Tax=Saccharopolyspora erythraea TaxID=1836 RepID=A4F754_SACEN|nr:hypothetical protein N599_23930 [Saccharopolyspora erythraea D]QRK90526.1 hypothetical protein JQX30_03210 [Saccharopolyspora erythraea]CAL99878.1 hypothetical protein SACE_0532 [Saccharopolyspora erythraea NRRL 2338]
MFEVLESGPPREVAVAAARHVVEWSRRNTAQARVLLAGSAAFGESEWTPQARDELRRLNEEMFAAMAEVARGTGTCGELGYGRFSLAVVDLPIAVVRRNLTRGDEIPEHEVAVVVEAVRDLLADGQGR